MASKPTPAIALLLIFSVTLGVFGSGTPDPAWAETAYQRSIRIAELARKKGDFNTALINYRRALQASPDGANDSYINTAVNTLLQTRLQTLERTAPRYVQAIKLGDQAFSDGDYDTAISHYKTALIARPGDYYAGIRIQQSQCIKTKKPATGAQFRVFCPAL